MKPYIRAIIIVLCCLIMTSILYIDDKYFTDRWEWPTEILLPFMILMAGFYILPGIILSNVLLKNIFIYLAVSILIYIPVAFNKYIGTYFRNLFGVKEYTYLNLFFVIVPFMLYSTLITLIGYLIEKKLLQKQESAS